MIEFSDGSRLEASGELRIEESKGTYYVLGDGMFLPQDSLEAAEALLKDIKSQTIYMNMKVLKSPGARARVNDTLEDVAKELGEPKP